MKIIAHRALLDGPDKTLENSPNQIRLIIDYYDFDIEIDLSVVHTSLYLGHDELQYKVDLDLLDNNRDRLWVHCKNLNAVKLSMERKYNWFYHTDEKFVLTSKGYLWHYPGTPCINKEKSIAVLPEREGGHLDFINCYGVCTDYARDYL